MCSVKQLKCSDQLHTLPAGSTNRFVEKWAQEIKIAAVKAAAAAELHCGWGTVTLEIKWEGIMFKQRNVVCSSRRWTDEVISFSCMMCSPIDQENCKEGYKRIEGNKNEDSGLLLLFDFDYFLWLVAMVIIYYKYIKKKHDWSAKKIAGQLPINFDKHQLVCSTQKGLQLPNKNSRYFCQ